MDEIDDSDDTSAPLDELFDSFVSVMDDEVEASKVQISTWVDAITVVLYWGV